MMVNLRAVVPLSDGTYGAEILIDGCAFDITMKGADMAEVKAEDPRANEPASKQQTWALRLATGKDYRGAGLTRKQASDLLNEANAKSGYQYKGKPRGGQKVAAA